MIPSHRCEFCLPIRMKEREREREREREKEREMTKNLENRKLMLSLDYFLTVQWMVEGRIIIARNFI